MAHLSMAYVPGLAGEDDSCVPFTQAQHTPHTAAMLYLSIGESEPTPWSLQMPAMGPDTLGGIAPDPTVAGDECFKSPTEWCQAPSFVDSSIQPDRLEAGLFLSQPVSWTLPSPPATAVDSAQHCQLALAGSGYSFAPLESASVAEVQIPWAAPEHHDESARLGGHPVRPTSGADELSDGNTKRLLPDTWENDERWTTRRSRRPSFPMYIGAADAEPRGYITSPVTRRHSTICSSQMTPSLESTFGTTDGYPRSQSAGTSTSTSTTVPSPSPDATAQRKPTRPRRRRASTTTATTTTATTHQGGAAKPTLQARNRAAASRYRAKTQAALSQLEADERDASVRHRSLLARAGELRDEVLRLKTELLRHAGCDCPLIREYVSRAAGDVCRGLVVGGDGGGGPGTTPSPWPWPWLPPEGVCGPGGDRRMALSEGLDGEASGRVVVAVGELVNC